jgi:amino acid transporter
VSATDTPQFERVLTRLDLLLFTISAILTIDTLASAASMGVAWFTWWGITMLLFFIPYGLITAELGAAWPGEGGLLLWVDEGLGPWWGGMASWLYWINNAYWVPSVYLIFAGTFDRMFLGSGSIWLQASIAILLTWITVGIGTVKLNVSKWIPNVGAIVKLAIFAGLGALGAGALLFGRSPANDFSPGQLVPRWDDSLAYLPVLLYNTLGFELMSGAGDEMRDPQRDVPRAILVSGAVISVVYALGALGILLAVPLGELSIVTGTFDALASLGRPFGAFGDTLVLLLGLGFLYACIGNIVTWSLGANRVAQAAAAQGTFPAAFGRLHPRYKTPYVAFVWMGLIASGLLIGNAALSDKSANVFWMTFKLSGLCFLLTYLLVFPAFLVLRHTRARQPRPYRLPGGMPAAWAAAALTTLFIAGASALFFKPAPDSEAPLREGLLLGLETLVTLGVGAMLIRRLRPAAALPAAPPA